MESQKRGWTDLSEGEELEAAFTEWYEKQIKFKQATKGPKPTPFEQKLQEMKDKDPVFARMVNMLDFHQEPESLVDNEFVPDERAYAKEAERLESMRGRYPWGFRHYENYLAYKRKFPEATIQDYREDSKCSIYNFNLFVQSTRKCRSMSSC